MFMADVYLNDMMLNADLLYMYAAYSLFTTDTDFSLRMSENDFRYSLPAWSLWLQIEDVNVFINCVLGSEIGIKGIS
jgi:hypothetical protein